MALLLAGCAFGQWGNVVFPGGGNAAGRSWGNVVFPGRGSVVQNPFSITNPYFASQLGATVGVPVGIPGNRGGGRGDGGGHRGAGGHGRSQNVYVPYAYPVYNGADYFGGQQPVEQQPNVTVVYPPQQAPVVVNQAPPPGAYEPQQPEERIRVYQAPSRETAEQPVGQPAGGTPGYLLAFKDHAIYSAVAYWVEDDTLHYFTSGNTLNQASLSLLDRDLTIRLNRERGVDIRLPAPPQ